MKHPLLLPTLFLLAITAGAQTATPDLAQLTQGVTKIGSPGAPGRVCVFGDAAFPVVVGKADKTVQPVVGAARLDAGRVVVFGHNGYFDAATLKEADTGKFLANCISWSARGPARPTVVVLGAKGLTDALAAIGVAGTPANLAALAPNSVLVADAGRMKAGEVEVIVKFIRAGGGLVTSATGWGWQQLNPGKELAADLVVNRILNQAGLAIADHTVSDTTQGGFTVSANVPPLTHAGRALSAALASTGGTVKLIKADEALISASLIGAMESLPANDTQFLPRLRALANTPKATTLPTPKTPVKSDNLAGRLLVTMQGQSLRKLAPEQTRAHPAAETFPGAVPATAPRLGAVTVNVDTRVRDWHSTGLYAAPGEVITVTIPASAAKKKLRVRIGAHKDELWHLDSWKRFPEITREFSLDAPVTRAACAFGGLIYIDVPKDCALGNVPVQISGAVAAPFYVHGKSSVEQWRASIRNNPAPWGELASSKVIITLPSEVLRALDDPKALMDTWDMVLDLVAELATIPKDRERPERIVCDEQISAGYMHSGYPIMTWMDQPKNFASRDSLFKGNWGIFHELGHNHQVGEWTFEGTGEVTCNLFSFYVYDKLCGVKPRDYVHGGSGTPVIQLHKKYFATGTPSFERWKSEPFTALCMYAQMQDAFGWEPYKKVFAEYRRLPANLRPKTEQDKRDQWMVRMSQAVGKNLGPFFTKWQIPVTDTALKSIAHLPGWMPPELG
jgi:Peptidase M60, enhancin and enhancin-like/N-terminal domain of M60-like peptidases